MTAAILTIGTEITRGELLDANAAWLAARLTELGFEVVQQASVPDETDAILHALDRLSREVRVLMVTGGLGPTTDDLTAACAARASGAGMVVHAPTLQSIERKLAAVGRSLTPSVARMADVPANAEVLGNPVGTAPGFEIPLNGARVFFAPGVPREMQAIFEELVVPRIGPMVHARAHQLLLNTYGLPESVVGDRLAGLESQIPGLTIGYRATFPEVDVKLLVRNDDLSLARSLAAQAAGEVRARLGTVVHGEGGRPFAASVGEALRSRSWTLAAAESCTGGLLGTMLTDVPGASDYFLLSAVTYANRSKEHVLGVSSEILIAYGAVSAECAAAMARGVRRLSGADLAVAITGVAGPSGGSSEKPVGLVHFALATEDGVTLAEKHFPFDRARIRKAAAYFALGMVRDACAGPRPTATGTACG